MLPSSQENCPHPMPNLDVAETRSGCQAAHLADWSQGEAGLLDSHWHVTGSGSGHWPMPEPHCEKKTKKKPSKGGS